MCFDITDPQSTKMATISPTNGTRSHKHITSIMVVIMGVISHQQDAIFLQRHNEIPCNASWLGGIDVCYDLIVVNFHLSHSWPQDMDTLYYWPFVQGIQL